jgi:hypothetical protein
VAFIDAGIERHGRAHVYRLLYNDARGLKPPPDIAAIERYGEAQPVKTAKHTTR